MLPRPTVRHGTRASSSARRYRSKLRDIWAIRVRLQFYGRIRDLALFDLAIDSKLRACDLVRLRVRDVSHGDRVGTRAIVWPYLWIDATYVKLREAGRIVSVAVIIAVAVNTDGQREVLGMSVGALEAEPFWTSFLRSLTRRGLRGVKLVIADAHEGLKAAGAKVLKATAQRCRVHFMRNVLAHVPKGQRQMVAALIRTVFAQQGDTDARRQWRAVTDQLRERFPKIGTLMDNSEADVLAHLSFPKAHRLQIHSTNPLERLNAEVKRRTDVVGIFPNEAAIVRLVGALLLEQNKNSGSCSVATCSLKACRPSATINPRGSPQ